MVALACEHHTGVLVQCSSNTLRTGTVSGHCVPLNLLPKWIVRCPAGSQQHLGGPSHTWGVRRGDVRVLGADFMSSSLTATFFLSRVPMGCLCLAAGIRYMPGNVPSGGLEVWGDRISTLGIYGSQHIDAPSPPWLVTPLAWPKLGQ